MADLLTTHELALWTSKDVAEVAIDPFAAEVIDKVSQMVQFLGGHPEWTLDVGVDAAPYDVRMVVLQVCKRSYENPRQVVQEGNVGPIGGDRVLDAAALLFDLTETERATLTKYNPDGDPAGGGSELFVISTTREPGSTLIPERLYVSDNQQVGMTPDESAYPSWDFPLFNPGDPGSDTLYNGEE